MTITPGARTIVAIALVACGCTASGSSRAASACDLLRASEVEAVTGDTVASSGPRTPIVDSASSEVDVRLCGYATDGQWGEILVSMQISGQAAFASALEGASGQRGFAATTVEGRRAFVSDSGVGVLADGTFVTISAQNSVHFLPVAQRLVMFVLPRL